MTTFKTPPEIKKGDAFLRTPSSDHAVWTAVGDAQIQRDGDCHIPIRYADGGRSVRIWSPADFITLPVREA